MEPTFTMRHLSIAVVLTGSTCWAQVNGPGRFQIGIAGSFGGHATHFENSITVAGIRFAGSHDDGAATFSVPLDLQVGISPRMSLGLCVEPGSYVDSAGTHPNGFLIVGISPRFYVINKDHFALFANADVGMSALRIGEVVSGSKQYDDTYAGGHFRLGAQAQWYFGSTFGINAGLKFVAHSLKWRDRDPEDPLFGAAAYQAELRTAGLQFQVGMQVKL